MCAQQTGQKVRKKVFNWQRFICTEVTSYKIHTLHIWPSPYILQFAKTYPPFIAILFYTLSVWLIPCLKDLLWKNNYIFQALISNYDFHFGWWPTEGDYSQTGPTKFLATSETKSVWQQIKDMVGVHSFAWLMLHSFGIKLIYPGSIQLLQASISSTLQDGRAQLVIEKG